MYPEMFGKSLMGLQSFEVKFFFVEKVTKCDLALHQSIGNHLKVTQRRIMTCLTIL